MTQSHHELLIVGGGTAGITVAAQLLQREGAPRIAIVDAARQHFYQPLWTLVGGGVFPREASMRSMDEVMPSGVTWIRDRVADFEPEKNAVKLESGQTLTYDQLVVAPGIQLDWKKIDGLVETLGKNGVTSNYDYDTVSYTWDLIRKFQGGMRSSRSRARRSNVQVRRRRSCGSPKSRSASKACGSARR